MKEGMAIFSVEYLQYVADGPGWMLPVYVYMLSLLYTLIH